MFKKEALSQNDSSVIIAQIFSEKTGPSFGLIVSEKKDDFRLVPLTLKD